ncbi:P-loop NTPase fold protein [Clostridium butyricum]|uniref:P-loop NTPase fold protein n=1 Tax=Clostridium butyricum TaxID=1492 RepID=UPI00374E4B34
MENKFLSEDDIIKNIREYIDDTVYNRAVLLDGQWGSGKTYFIKNKLKKELEAYEKIKNNREYKKKKIIYISLYGIKSTRDVSNEIYLNCANIKNRKKAAIISLGGKVFSDLMKNKGFDLEKYLKASLFKPFIDINNCILIFDDLERCKCNLNDILGYINDFVEHKETKVIIVANEDELGNISEEKNKYYERVKSERAQKNKELVDDFSSQLGMERNEENKVMKCEETKSIEEYLTIKEKLIGTTIKYKPNLEQSFKNIIEENIQNSRLKLTLIREMSKLIRLAEEKQHINLRTFQFFISKIIKIYSWIENKDYQDSDEVLKMLIKYTFQICIYYKKGMYMNEWEDGNLYGDIALEPYKAEDNTGYIYSNNTVKGFRFIDEFIVDSKVPDKRVVERTIELFLEDLKETGFENDPLNKLKYWHVLEDYKVERYVNEIYEWLGEKKYSPKRFPELLKSLVILESVGFDKYRIKTDILPIMAKQIKESSSKVNYNEIFYYISDDKKIIDKYTEYYNELKLAADTEKYNSYIEEFKYYLENIDEWSDNSNLINHIIKDEYKIFDGLLSNTDLEKLKHNIVQSNTKQLDCLRGTILSLYNKENIYNLKKDKEALESLIQFISKIEVNCISKTKKNNLMWFQKNLSDIVQKMK